MSDVVFGQNNCGKSVVLFSFFRNCFVLVGACEKPLRAQRLQENHNCRKAPLFACVSGESAGCTKICKSEIAPTCSRGPFRSGGSPRGTRGRFIGFPSRCFVPRNESRRSLRYKGGVTRGREEQPQVNCSIKRGSPITKMLAVE